MHHKFRLPILTLALALEPVLARADTNADILREIEALKAKVQQLEAQVRSQQTQIEENQRATAEAGQTADRADVQLSGVKQALETSGFRGLTITGMIAPAYVYNQAQQSGSFVFLNRANGAAGDSTIYNYDNSYFGSAYLSFAKETEEGTQWTLVLAPERGAGAISNGSSIVHEASVSIPLEGDSNTRLIAGQIPDWEGYESTWGNEMKPITHNLLFDFAELTSYTGVGMHLMRGKWEVKAMLANMNSPRYYYSGNGGRAPAAVFRADYAIPGYDDAGVGFWGMVGKLPNANVSPADGATALYRTGTSSAAMFEVDGYVAKGDWGYYGQIGYGQQTGAAYNGDTAKWWGLSGMMTYNFSPRLLGFARADYLNNKKNGGGLPGGYMNLSSSGQGFNGVNGFGPGYVRDPLTGEWVTEDGNSGANRYALSLGMNYLYNQSTTLKLEYRYDRASRATFLNTSDGSYRKYNNLLSASVVVSF